MGVRTELEASVEQEIVAAAEGMHLSLVSARVDIPDLFFSHKGEYYGVHDKDCNVIALFGPQNGDEEGERESRKYSRLLVAAPLMHRALQMMMRAAQENDEATGRAVVRAIGIILRNLDEEA